MAEEVLGESRDVVVLGEGVEIRVPIERAAARRVFDGLSRARDSERVSLVLEGIRGTRDATILTAFLGRGPRAGDERTEPYRAEGVGLYGLRRASMALAGERSGGGLSYALDVTPFFEELGGTGGDELDALTVSLRPEHALPVTERITIERVRLVARRVTS